MKCIVMKGYVVNGKKEGQTVEIKSEEAAQSMIAVGMLKEKA